MDTRVHWARTEAEEDRGGRAQGNSRPLCLHTRHWEILKHIQSFTHQHARGHAPAHCSTEQHLGGKPLLQLRPWLRKLIRALHLGSPDQLTCCQAFLWTHPS